MAICYNKLWKLLIDRGMTKTELRLKAGVTTNVIANLGKNESVQVEALYKICHNLFLPKQGEHIYANHTTLFIQ